MRLRILARRNDSNRKRIASLQLTANGYQLTANSQQLIQTHTKKTPFEVFFIGSISDDPSIRTCSSEKQPMRHPHQRLSYPFRLLRQTHIQR